MSSRWYMMSVGLLVGLAILLIAISTATQSSGGAYKNKNTLPTVFNEDPKGYKGFRLTLEKVHLPFTIWKSPFDKLSQLPSPSTMTFIGPLDRSEDRRRHLFTQESMTLLLDWVASGNTAIVLDDFSSPTGKALLKKLHLKRQTRPKSKTESKTNPKNTASTQQEKPLDPMTEPMYSAHPLAPEQTQPKVTTLVHQTPYSLKTDILKTSPPEFLQKNQILLKDQAGAPLLLQQPYGQGKIILGTPLYLASNELIPNTDIDNFQYLVNLLVSQETPILINEYIHGFLDRPENILAYLYGSPAGRILDQVFYLFVMVFWLSLLPWKPLRLEYIQQGGINLHQFIDSMAGIYYKTRAAELVLGPVVKDIQRTLERQGGLSFSPNRSTFNATEQESIQRLLEERLRHYSNRSNRESPIGKQANTKYHALIQDFFRARQAVFNKEKLPPSIVLHLSQSLSTLQDRMTPPHDRHAVPS